jgi:putative oxidoreductase
MIFINALQWLEHFIVRLVPLWLVGIVLRMALAVPFFKSGLTKWDGFLRLSETPVLLFSEEFKIHFLGHAYPYPYPLFVAWSSSIAEIILPILLVIGFGTRLAAFGILLMTVLIQLTIPDGWANFHLPWAGLALALIALGPGKLSLDRFLSSRR